MKTAVSASTHQRAIRGHTKSLMSFICQTTIVDILIIVRPLRRDSVGSKESTTIMYRKALPVQVSPFILIEVGKCIRNFHIWVVRCWATEPCPCWRRRRVFGAGTIEAHREMKVHEAALGLTKARGNLQWPSGSYMDSESLKLGHTRWSVISTQGWLSDPADS
jgi:hypothetical protein